MNTSTRKTISIVFLCITILWFLGILLFESRYAFGVFRQQPTTRDAFGTIYEEQIEGINFVVMIIYLIPGVFSLIMYRRFKKEY
jgi:hypothetical protein